MKKWLTNKFLPLWAKETVLEENRTLKKRNQQLEQEIAVLKAKYCTGGRCLQFKDRTKWEEKKDTVTNADRIRAMSDEELANFFADRCLMVGYSQLTDARYNLTATQIEAQKQTAYCILMRWFKQPAEG